MISIPFKLQDLEGSQPLTWREREEALPQGLSHEARELIRQATAKERVQARVRTVLRTVFSAVQESVGAELGVEDCRMARLLLRVGLNGSGGHANTGLGGASARLAPFHALGKGRRQASDGPTWDHAMSEALQVVQSLCAEAGFSVFNAAEFQHAMYQVCNINAHLLTEEAAAFCRRQIQEHLEDPEALDAWDDNLTEVRQAQLRCSIPFLPTHERYFDFCDTLVPVMIHEGLVYDRQSWERVDLGDPEYACDLRPLTPTAAGVFIVHEYFDDHVLLFNKAGRPGPAFPCGKVAEGEDPRVAAERECYEETGLLVDVSDSVQPFVGVADDGTVTVIYAAELIGGEMLVSSDEGTPFWGSPDETDHGPFPTFNAAVRKHFGF